jgi:hypothetical protein
MCLNCLNTARPDRGTVCLDEGAYLVNFKACASCGVRAMPRTAKREEEATVDSEDETPEGEEPEETEEVQFQHVCSECGHVVASHYYRSVYSTRSQRFLMECMLCGRAADERVHHFLRPHPSLGDGDDGTDIDATISAGGPAQSTTSTSSSSSSSTKVAEVDGAAALVAAESHSAAFAALGDMLQRQGDLAPRSGAGNDDDQEEEEDDEWDDDSDDGW